jgi:streptogramin lyase
MSMTGFVQQMQRWRAMMAGIAIFAALLGRAVPASALPLKLFPSPFPEDCGHEQPVFGPSNSMWFLLRCPIHYGGSEGSGIGRLPINDPEPRLVRLLKASPKDLTVGPEGDLWFTEGTAIDSESESPSIDRLTVGGQLTRFPTPVRPNLSYTLHEQVEQIIPGPENDLWFIASGFGGNVLARITPAGVLSQFPAQQVLNGRHELETKGDEVPRALARAANGNLWMGEYFEAGTIGLVEPGGIVRQVRVGEPGQGPVTPADPMVGTPDGGVWFVEQRGFTQVGPEGAVLSHVSVKEGVGRSFTGSVATTGNDVLWVTEQEAGEVLKRVTSTGEFGELVFCSSNETPEGMAVGPEGDLWFAARTGKDFGRLDLARLTRELERERTQVRICRAKATSRSLRARVACESLNLSNACDYQATVTLANAPRKVVGIGRFVGRALPEPEGLSVPLRPIVRSLLRQHKRLRLRLTLRSGAHVAARSFVVLHG